MLHVQNCVDGRIAIWDNRSVFHSATFDYDGLGERFGNRAVGIGEVPVSIVLGVVIAWC